MTPYLVVGAFAAGLLVAGVAQGWRYGEQLAVIRAEQAQAVADAADKRLALEAKYQLLETQRYGELRHVQGTTDRLTAELSAAKRLSVRVARCVPAAPGATSVDDGAQRADLHPEVARDLVRIAGDADQCAVKLTALQERIRASMTEPKR